MILKIPTLSSLPSAAQQFAAAMGDRTIFAFSGQMGSGKTTFIRALCEALGVTESVNSPTFAIVNEYLSGTGNPIYHFDFYRIKSLQEALDIGLEDYLYSGHLCLIEWPEYIEKLLPEETVKVAIEEQEDGSRIVKM
ncbi:MAG: tRNA (adenosine(37)-N6)-threonylcarbamoyltransferase complex ATPase subunit type 1 TsaE [Bacteroidaceae bacterium]|jgi:tRNA threonylcarbamoyladenosine biosynthesis protein TsaE|nr:tRNA (adenosine(37)-N6)-threonylcarbamoyltransferase complex ATPase subunit type 1 TsaE [Bacteroidaceae bacterium]